jgi:hypothetical protein
MASGVYGVRTARGAIRTESRRSPSRAAAAGRRQRPSALLRGVGTSALIVSGYVAFLLAVRGLLALA